MGARLLALAAFLAAALFAVACGSDGAQQGPSAAPTSAESVLPAANPTGTSLPQTATPIPASTPVPPATATRAPIATPGPLQTSSPPAPAPAGSTIIVPYPFENALQARDSLLGNARFGAPMDGLAGLDPLDLKAYPGWAGAYPQLRLVGSSVNATPQTVSVYRNLLQDNQPASATNPKVIVFTVMDAKGLCTAGVIRGYPTYSEYVQTDIGAPACNASAAVAALRR